MPTTTPSFGWPVPVSTDLVKDGATAIESLGDAIDASMTDLKGGTTGQVLAKATNTDMDFTWVAQDDSNAIQNAIVDAKGDLIAATANDTPARLAVGANDTVLTADSTTATGLKWAAPASGGGMTLINTGGTALSGASVTISSIPSTYTNLFILMLGYYTATGDAATYVRFNSDTGNKYTWSYVRNINTTVVGSSALTGTSAIINTRTIAASTAAQTANAQINVMRYAESTANKFFTYSAGAVDPNTSGVQTITGNGNFADTTAISSVTVYADFNFSGGTIYVYGVK
jgi:hypothetical protein